MKLLNALLILSATILTACADSSSSSAPQGRLLVFGDSFSSMPGSFAWQLGPALGLTEVNLAVPGSSIQYPEQIGQILDSDMGPNDTVIFLSGINNMRGFGDAPEALSLYEQYLNMAFEKFSASGAQVYIGTTPALLYDAQDAITANHYATPAIASEYAAIIKQTWAYFQENNNTLHIVDVNAQFVATRNGTICPDLTHPSAEGHAQLLQMFLNEIQKQHQPGVME